MIENTVQTQGSKHVNRYRVKAVEAMDAGPERQECVVAFKEVCFNMMGSQSRAGAERQDTNLKGPTSSLLQP